MTEEMVFISNDTEHRQGFQTFYDLGSQHGIGRHFLIHTIVSGSCSRDLCIFAPLFRIAFRMIRLFQYIRYENPSGSSNRCQPTSWRKGRSPQDSRAFDVERLSISLARECRHTAVDGITNDCILRQSIADNGDRQGKRLIAEAVRLTKHQLLGTEAQREQDCHTDPTDLADTTFGHRQGR